MWRFQSSAEFSCPGVSTAQTIDYFRLLCAGVAWRITCNRIWSFRKLNTAESWNRHAWVSRHVPQKFSAGWISKLPAANRRGPINRLSEIRKCFWTVRWVGLLYCVSSLGCTHFLLNTHSLQHTFVHQLEPYGRLWNARWQQTYQVKFHCLRSSERAHITENNGFYLVSLLPPSVPKVSHYIFTLTFKRNTDGVFTSI